MYTYIYVNVYTYICIYVSVYICIYIYELQKYKYRNVDM